MPRSHNAEMPFLDHLEELRWRILWSLLALGVGIGIGFFLVLQFEVIGLLARPITPFLEGQKLVFTHPAEPFSITMKVAFTDTRTNMVLWSNDSLSFSSEYELNTRGNTAIDGSGFLDQERSSFDRIATDIARSVVTAIVEAF